MKSACFDLIQKEEEILHEVFQEALEKRAPLVYATRDARQVLRISLRFQKKFA